MWEVGKKVGDGGQSRVGGGGGYELVTGQGALVAGRGITNELCMGRNVSLDVHDAARTMVNSRQTDPIHAAPCYFLSSPKYLIFIIVNIGSSVEIALSLKQPNFSYSRGSHAAATKTLIQLTIAAGDPVNTPIRRHSSPSFTTVRPVSHINYTTSLLFYSRSLLPYANQSSRISTIDSALASLTPPSAHSAHPSRSRV